MFRMLDFKERSRMRRFMYGIPTILSLVAIFIFVAHGALGMYQKNSEATEKKEKAEDKLSELEQRKVELSADILNLSTDRGLEGEIRDRYMVAKEGENVMIVSDPDAQQVHTVTVADAPPTAIERMMGAVGITR